MDIPDRYRPYVEGLESLAAFPAYLGGPAPVEDIVEEARRARGDAAHVHILVAGLAYATKVAEETAHAASRRLGQLRMPRGALASLGPPIVGGGLEIVVEALERPFPGLPSGFIALYPVEETRAGHTVWDDESNRALALRWRGKERGTWTALELVMPEETTLYILRGHRKTTP